MSNKNLYSIHHIGGRRGTSALKHEFFQKDSFWTFYDADESCIDQIKSKTDGNRTQVLPFCLFSEKKQVKFNINVDPTTNSIFDFNSKFEELYLDHDYPLYGPMDFRLGDTVKVLEKIEMNCTSMDILAQDASFTAPDILSIDAQGASYDVLEGSVNCLKSKTIAVSCEVEFVPLYKGQKLYGDVANLLLENGFIFCSFLKIGKGSMYRESVGLRGDGFQTYADSFFLKDIDSILEESSDLEAVNRLYKLAYAALVYGYTEYAIKSLRTAKDTLSIKPSKDVSYVDFLDAFYDLAKATEYKMLQSFDDVFSRDANLRRFSEDQDEVDYDSYKRLQDVLDVLTQKALSEGVRTLLVISSERFIQKMSTQTSSTEGVQYVFDNAIPDCEHDGVGEIGDIPKESFILIMASHKNFELIAQLKERGVSEDRIYVTGHWIPEVVSGKSKVEAFLCKNGFDEVANLLKNKREKQSYKRNPILS